MANGCARNQISLHDFYLVLPNYSFCFWFKQESMDTSLSLPCPVRTRGRTEHG